MAYLAELERLENLEVTVSGLYSTALLTQDLITTLVSKASANIMLDISAGNITGLSSVNKFGSSPN